MGEPRPSTNDKRARHPSVAAGEAYVAPDRAALAGEFQKILDHTAASSGIAGRERWRIWEWLAPMPCQSRTSQEANAHAARVRSLPAYKDFLTLWKEADPDIPILKEAKAEYAKLQ